MSFKSDVRRFFTKPLQGQLFRKFRDVILGYIHISELDEPQKLSTEEPSPEERVGKDITEGISITSDDDPSVIGNKEKTVTWADIVSGKEKDKNRMSST